MLSDETGFVFLNRKVISDRNGLPKAGNSRLKRIDRMIK